MTVETISIERLTCDRCGGTEDIPSDIKDGSAAARAKWGQIGNAQGLQGGCILAGGRYSMHLCPRCSDGLKAWSNYASPVSR